jgi:hypothetical protein
MFVADMMTHHRSDLVVASGRLKTGVQGPALAHSSVHCLNFGCCRQCSPVRHTCKPVALQGRAALKRSGFGDTLPLADVHLAPQLFPARRSKVSLDALPRIGRVSALAGLHPAFVAAEPENQLDAG